MIRAEHEHLLRENIAYFYSYGHDWRDEKEQHEVEVAEGYRESLLSDRAQNIRSDNLSRAHDMSGAR